MKRWIAALLALALIALPTLSLAEEGGEATPALGMSMEKYAEINGLNEVEDDGAPMSNEGYVPENLDRKIIGSNDLVEVGEYCDQFPFSAIAYLLVHARCGCEWSCSGFMVGPSGMMTSGNGLVCTDHGQTADRITMYFGYRSSRNYFYKYDDATSYWYGSDYSTAPDRRWDYGYIKLRERVGDRTGWFGTTALSNSELDGGIFNVSGYRDGTLKFDYDIAYVQNDYLIHHFADTQPGFGGAPVFTDDGYAVAVNVAESNSYDYNIARRFTGSLFSEMRSNGIFD